MDIELLSQMKGSKNYLYKILYRVIWCSLANDKIQSPNKKKENKSKKEFGIPFFFYSKQILN